MVYVRPELVPFVRVNMQEPFGIEPANSEVPWPHGDRVIRILGGNSMCPDRHQQLGQSED
jgi:hypothetical protein